MAFLVKWFGEAGLDEDVVNDSQHAQVDELDSTQAYCLYVSHLLSMWNSRMYEFGVILLVQISFPGDLTASSINGITETVCVLFFSSALGRWVDRGPSRLHTLLLTIITNRITVMLCCLIWSLILASEQSTYRRLLFASVLTLGMAEKLSRMTNILSMERDWVPTLASRATEGVPPISFGLTHLNTIMRRIDVACKLAAPLAISALISTSTPGKGVLAIAISSGLSWAIECWCIRRVWNKQRRLRASKEDVDIQLKPLAHGIRNRPTLHSCSGRSWASPRFYATHFQTVVLSIRAWLHSHGNSLRYYFNTCVWIPSVCVAILHGSVLSYSGTFITYLLNAGFALTFVTIVKSIGSIVEIGTTFIFPWAVDLLSRTGPSSYSYQISGPDESRVSRTQSFLLEGIDGADAISEAKEIEQSQLLEPGVVRVALWGICFLFLSLIPVILSLFYLDFNLSNPSFSPSSSPLVAHPVLILVLFTFLSFSLLGRWTYDLATTQLTQTLVPAAHRSSFGGTEMSIVSCASLAHWVAAAVWHQQTDFKWLALASFVSVGVGSGAYWVWFRWWIKTGGVGKMYATGERHL